MSYFSVIKGLIAPTTARPIRIDPSTHARTSIEYEHHEVHGGNSYHTETFDETMAADATIILAFKTDDTTAWMHMIVNSWAPLMAHIEIWEGRTWTTETGAQEPIFNRDRNSANTSLVWEDTTGAWLQSMNVINKPALNADGTRIDINYFSDKRGGDEHRGVVEWILKQNETYVILLQSDKASNAGKLALDWYEHTNLD